MAAYFDTSTDKRGPVSENLILDILGDGCILDIEDFDDNDAELEPTFLASLAEDLDGFLNDNPEDEVDHADAGPSVAVFQSLQRCQIDYLYIEALKCLYENATVSVRLQDQNSKPIRLQRGVRQGYVISLKLFTAALEEDFKLLQWNGLGININGEYITHLRFADDIVVMVETMEEEPNAR